VVLLPDNAKGTADYLEVHWNKSPKNDDIMHNTDVCSGGIVFAWTDEWWKSGNVTQHDPGESANGAFPGGWGDEEWFGICGVEVKDRAPANFDKSHPDTLLPRAAFDRLKQLWK